ncbi:MAG TPA: hypothetical protein VH857_04680 [Actinomycetes bacterium]|nr:hypothetical protein [Actinomycetes bacterium]
MGTAKPFASTDRLVAAEDVGVPLGAAARVRLPSLEPAQALTASPISTVMRSGDVVLATRRTIMR